jgi:hypothetical protein
MEKRAVIEEGRTPREQELSQLKKASNCAPPELEQHTTQRLADAAERSSQSK